MSSHQFHPFIIPILLVHKNMGAHLIYTYIIKFDELMIKLIKMI